MSRRLVLLIVLSAILLTGFSVALSRRDSRDWRANRSRRLLPFPWRDAARVAITRPDGASLDFYRDADGQWKIRLPHDVADTLNPNAAEALAALATLAWREPQAGRAQPRAGEATTLTATSAAGQSVEIQFGDTQNNLRAAVIDKDGSVVYGVNQDLLDFLDWPAERYRSMLLASGGGGRKPRKIRLAPHSEGGDLAITLEQTPDGWFMTQPVLWPADESRLDIAIRWLDRLRAETVAAELTGDLEYFGFTAESTHVEAWYDTPSGAVHRRVEFGGDAGEGKIYARETGRSPIFTLPREAVAEISLDIAAKHPDSWRNFYRQRVLNRLGPDAPATIVVERLLPTPAKLTIAQRNDPNGMHWQGKLEENGAVRQFPIDAPDGKNQMLPLAALLTGLTNLRVKNFLADVPPGPETVRFTAHPAWRFSIRSSDGRELPGLTLYSADAEGNMPSGVPFVDGLAEPQELKSLPGQPANAGLAFSVPERGSVMETFGELSYLLCLPPYRYQSRRLVSLDPKKWSKIEIHLADVSGKAAAPVVFTRDTKGINEQWWRSGASPEPLMDDNNRFVGMLLELSQLRSEGFVQDASGDIAKFGLDRPEITAIVYSSSEQASPKAGDGRLFTLTLGREADAAGRRYARLNGEGPVFLLSSSIAKALGDEYK